VLSIKADKPIKYDKNCRYNILIILEVLNGSVLMHLTFLERKRLIIKK